MRLKDFSVWLLLPGLFACGGDLTDSAAVIVRDSAGVQIVENAGDLWAVEDRWRLSPDPVVQIGAVQGEAAYLFVGVRGVVALGDGRIVVADWGDNSLRWFDRNGRFLFRRGGEGDGPGEFSGLSAITVVAGDTLVAVDWSKRRFTPFGPDGEPGSSIRVHGLTAPPSRVYRLPDGNWIVGTSGFNSAQLGIQPEVGVYRLDSPILELSANGQQLDTVGVFPSSEVEFRAEGERFWIGSAPFGRNLGYGVSRGHIIVGTADRVEVDVYTSAGRLVRSFRALDVSTELTEEIQAAWRDFMRDQLDEASPEWRAHLERSISSTELPSNMPAYSSLLVDDEGNVWLGEFRFDRTPAERFLVFDTDGRFITAVTVPSNFQVMTIVRGHVYGRLTDELDVEYAAGYAIEK